MSTKYYHTQNELIAKQQAAIIDQGILNGQMMDEIETLKAHIKEALAFDEQALITGLESDIKTLRRELLTAGQTIKTREDRIAYLERVAESMNRQLEADNEQS